MRARHVAALVSVAMLVAVSCGGSDDDDSAATPASSSASEATATTDTAEAPATTEAAAATAATSSPDETTAPESSDTSAPAADVDYDPDGTYSFASFSAPQQWDPVLSANPGNVVWLNLVYDRLTHLTPDNEVIPGLAESWEYDDTGTELTLHLREGVQFQDGTPFDAAAVKANIERAKTLEGSVLKNDLAGVQSVEVVDDHTAKIVLSAPNSTFVALLSDRHGEMVSPAAMADPSLQTHPVGAGMYKFVSQSADKVTFERWDGYWNPDDVKVKTFEFVTIPDDAARLNALLTGQVDSASLTTGQVQQAKDAGMDVQVNSGLQYHQIYLNRSIPGLDDERVRQALNYAVDRKSLVQAIENGFGTANVQPFPDDYWAHSDDVGTDYYPYDPDKAKQLLADAGYADGFTFSMILPQPGVPAQLAEALQAMYAQVGVTMNIDVKDVATVGDVFFAQQQGQSMLGLVSPRQDPAIISTQMWVAAGPLNPGHMSSPDVEDLTAQVIAQVDQAEREPLMHQLVDAIVKEAFEVILYNSAQVMGSDPETVAVAPQVGNAKLEFRGVAVK